MALDSGTRVGPYEVTAQIGVGGMGEVYRATDTNLKRQVAIKVLPAAVAGDTERLARFQREAEVLAKLNHPNIAAIYGLEEGDGLEALVMELVEGPTLADRIAQGPIPIAEALPIAKQIAEALEAAHEQGIIHRDLKPANIKVRRDGTVKVLDFGLAKATEPAGAGAQVKDSQLATITAPAMTQTGAILGTAAYMSPEQAEGEPLDRRSDIFAFGAVLYEMVAGRRAFAGDSTARVLSSVLRDEPQPLGGSPEFDRVVQRCLRKSPMGRYGSMCDVRAALDAAGRTRQSSGRPAIAVLPFTNMSADPENQYFSDGLAEELINALTRLPGLQVASRTSAFRFRGSDADIRQVGRDLQVSTVVEGSVRRSGHRLRVTAQLINVADGYHLWSERYDREMADVFDIQDDIVESIVKAVAPTLVGDARTVVRRPTENLEAYELYLKGRHHWHLRTPSAMQVAQQVFEQVIALDPEYALAWAGVADCLSVRRVYGWASAAQLGARAREAATRALELDPSLAEANFAQAAYILYFEPGWRRAEVFLRKAIEINPRFAGALGYLALVLVADDGRNEVTTLIDRARDADPLSTYAHYLVACVYFIGRRFGEAQGAAQRVLELQPDALPGLWPLGLALSGLERHQAAVEAMERAATLSRAPFYVGMLGLVLARAGRSDDARRLLGELEERSGRGEYVGPQNLLAIHRGLGDRAAIRGALQACIADATPYFTVRVMIGPFLDAYLADPDIAQVHEALDCWRTR